MPFIYSFDVVIPWKKNPVSLTILWSPIWRSFVCVIIALRTVVKPIIASVCLKLSIQNAKSIYVAHLSAENSLLLFCQIVGMSGSYL